MNYLKEYFSHLPKRLLRLTSVDIPTKWYDYPLDLLFKFLDVLGLPEIFQFILSKFKTNYRTLSNEEKLLVFEFYSGQLDIESIRVNCEINKLSAKRAHAFVTFNTINFKKGISDAVFVHELMHVLQYQRYGSLYIYRALKAQNSKKAYDYGGIGGLQDAKNNKIKMSDFNFEQQAMIMEDYYRWVTQKNLDNPQLSKKIENIYISFYKQLFQKDMIS